MGDVRRVCRFIGGLERRRGLTTERTYAVAESDIDDENRDKLIARSDKLPHPSAFLGHGQVDADVFTELPVRTQTGPLTIPIACTAQRVKPSLSTQLVSFRGTATGEREVSGFAWCQQA